MSDDDDETLILTSSTIFSAVVRFYVITDGW